MSLNQDADIVIIVYDLSKDSETNKVTYWLEETFKNSFENVNKILVGNKYDLAEGKLCSPIDKVAWNLCKK